MRKIQDTHGPKMADYEVYASLLPTVRDFRAEASLHVKPLKDKTIWMINSTDKGGGVAEMIPGQIRILAELGVTVKWLVMETDNEHFFTLTKRVHNLIHGNGNTEFTDQDREIYEKVNRENAEKAIELIGNGDIVVIHDPQPAGIAGYLRKARKVNIVWRCHIGLEHQSKETEAAWKFLDPYLKDVDHYVFTAPEYIPPGFSGNVSIIPPSIDPLSHKNRYLSLSKCTGILHCSGLIPDHEPVIYDFFEHQVQRIQPDGSVNKATSPVKIDLLFRPIVTQVSRWDRLKGFRELMEGFVELKNNIDHYARDKDTIHKKRLKEVRLILAGPDPDSIQDDPEGLEVLKDLSDQYQKLPESLTNDIALLLLPMASQKENALIVNSLQKASSIIVQNSLQEGFGLTATEGMWKKIPMLVSNACGLTHQVRDGIDGKVNNDPKNPKNLAAILNYMLSVPKKRQLWGFNGQNHVIDRFIIFRQLSAWIEVFNKL